MSGVLQLLYTAVEDMIRPLSGPLGIRLRRGWYRWRLAGCGARLSIEPGVHIVGPEYVRVGDDAWIDRNAVLIAGPFRDDARVEVRGSAPDNPGWIEIGDRCHIGIGTIIQGHGGINIGHGFTTSAGCKLYSLSNDIRRCRSGTVHGGGYVPSYVVQEIRIGDNVWLGLDVKMVGHRIGSDVFVMPGSVVASDLPSSVVAAGSPAAPLRPRFEEVDQR